MNQSYSKFLKIRLTSLFLTLIILIKLVKMLKFVRVHNKIKLNL